MKEIKSLTNEELLEVCIKKKSQEASFLEIANIFKTNETDDDTRRFIMSKLDDLDKQQEIQRVKAKQKKKRGLINILIGIVFILLAFIWPTRTIVSILFHVFWAFGGFLLIRGLVSLLSGIRSSRSVYKRLQTDVNVFQPTN